MLKEEYIKSLTTEKTVPADVVLEDTKTNGDKIYVTDIRYIENNEVFYCQQRFVVIGEGTKGELTYKLK